MNYKKSRMISYILAISGFIIMAVVNAATDNGTIFVVLAITSFIMICAALVIQIMIYRCPHCNNLLPFRGSSGEYCRFCGKNLDK